MPASENRASHFSEQGILLNNAISSNLALEITWVSSWIVLISLQLWDKVMIWLIHCKSATAIPFILYIPFLGIARPQPQFMCLWTISLFPGSVHIFPPAEKADPSWKYIIRSQTHECGNWGWGPGIPFLGIFVSNFRHFVFAVFVKLCTSQYKHCCRPLQ